jgi:hypothetical protein
MTIEDNKFDWSCPLNFSHIKLTYFILRNRLNFKEIKYCSLNIMKINEAMSIMISELNESDIPYIIKNKTKDFDIYVENYKIILEPGQ